MIFIDSVKFSYYSDPVLDNLSLELQPGEIHGILGPNGSGKTTLLNMLAGRLAPDVGRVQLLGKSLTHSDIAYLEATPHFYPMITGAEYLNLFIQQNRDFNISRWNELFGLPLDQLIETYSSGMKKKLALMGVICLNRPVMLLDEPFNNLDMEANQLVSGILRLMADKGKLIVLTSHIIEILTTMTDSIHLLSDGRIEKTIPQIEFSSWKKTYRADAINAQLDKANDLLQ